MLKNFFVHLCKTCFFLGYLVLLTGAIWFVREQTDVDMDASKYTVSTKLFQDILPAHDNFPWKDSFGVESKEIFPAYKRISLRGEDINELVGFAFQVKGSTSYGEFSFFLGLDTEGKITGVQLVEHHEMKGVGEIFEDPENFFKFFVGKKVLKEDAPVIRGAYHTSEKMVQSVQLALDFYEENKALFLKRHPYSNDEAQNWTQEQAEAVVSAEAEEIALQSEATIE